MMEDTIVNIKATTKHDTMSANTKFLSFSSFLYNRIIYLRIFLLFVPILLCLSLLSLIYLVAAATASSDALNVLLISCD